MATFGKQIRRIMDAPPYYIRHDDGTSPLIFTLAHPDDQGLKRRIAECASHDHGKTFVTIEWFGKLGADKYIFENKKEFQPVPGKTFDLEWGMKRLKHPVKTWQTYRHSRARLLVCSDWLREKSKKTTPYDIRNGEDLARNLFEDTPSIVVHFENDSLQPSFPDEDTLRKDYEQHDLFHVRRKAYDNPGDTLADFRSKQLCDLTRAILRSQERVPWEEYHGIVSRNPE